MQVLFFDGECVLCNKTALRVAKLNVSKNIHFASLQSDLAQEKLNTLARNNDSIVFIDVDKVYIKSEAVFEIIKHLPKLKWLSFLRFLPLSFRDKIYDLIAANRIKWFGKQELCEIPPIAFRDRYLS